MSKADLDLLNSAAAEITTNAAIKHKTQQIEEQLNQQFNHETQTLTQNTQQDQNDSDLDSDLDDDDPVLREIQAKRLQALKDTHLNQKKMQLLGHGEYREIVEEDFLKEVCNSTDVVVHFYHREFFRCKIVDKHLRILAQKHRTCKFVHLNAEKAPFFVQKLAIQMLPTVIVFKDGVKVDMLCGFDDLGGKDTFRTEVLESWMSKAGAFKLKRGQAFEPTCCDSDVECCSDDDSDY